MIRKYSFQVVCFVVVLSVFSSCRSKMVGVKSVAAKQQVVALFENAPHLDSFRSQIQINTNGLSAKGDLRIVKNTAIFLSVQAFLGIEVARLKITPDSLIAVDRLHRRYFADTFAHIYGFNKQGINYFTIQSLFLNSIYILGRDSLNKNDVDAFYWEVKNDETNLTSKKDEGCQFQLDQNLQLKQSILGDKNDRLKLTWSYSDFAKIAQLNFPQNMSLEMSSPKRKIAATLQFAKIELNKSFQIDTQVPLRYSKVDLNEILTIFSGL